MSKSNVVVEVNLQQASRLLWFEGTVHCIYLNYRVKNWIIALSEQGNLVMYRTEDEDSSSRIRGESIKIMRNWRLVPF